MKSEIRIANPYVHQLIEAEQERTKEKTATRCAERIIIEYLAAKAYTGGHGHAPLHMEVSENSEHQPVAI